MGYGTSQNNFTFNDNRIDLNADWNNWAGWLQLEHSQPPQLGRTFSGLRKIRVEYSKESFTIKLGDIYEFWGRGLLLNQIDDQTTNFDNGIRGMFLGYENGLFTFNHINGNSEIWNFGNAVRIPEYKNSHNV